MTTMQGDGGELPDVNVWFALAHAQASSHAAAVRWLSERSPDLRLGFCRITQLGLLRLLTQASALDERVLTQREAWRVVDTLTLEREVSFYQEPTDLESVLRTLSSRDQASPKLWTDDYLAAFAIAAGFTLVTFDKALAARVPFATLLRQ